MSTIWIVEDEQEHHALMSFVLERQGYSIRSFWDGTSIIRALEDSRPDLVILDIGLPFADGFSVCHALRADPTLDPVPVIVTSARKELAARCKMFDLGADDFLQKPFDTLELLVRIKNRLRRIRSRARPAVEAGDMLVVSDLVLDLRNLIVRVDGREEVLTQSEFSILKLLAAEPGRAFDTEDLLTRALGYPPRLGNPDILRTHIRNLRKKIERDPNNPERLINRPRVGYLLQVADLRAGGPNFQELKHDRDTEGLLHLSRPARDPGKGMERELDSRSEIAHSRPKSGID